MKELWRETFHDSFEYIDLVFDSYFSPGNVFFHYDGELLVAAMLCVPYDFIDTDDTLYRGLYLCGLATRPEYRNRGVMSALMNEAEISASERGYDMTFLIPADSHLREYYMRKGYVNASYRKKIRIDKDIHNNANLNIYTVQQLLDSGRLEFIESLGEWCRKIEISKQSPRLLHSELDMMAVLRENENAIFLTDDTFDLEYPILAKVISVVFPDAKFDSEGKVTVAGIYFEDKHSSLTNSGKLTDIILLSAFRKAEDIFLQHPVFEMPSEPHGKHEERVEPYAMIKWLRKTAENLKIENKIFEISLLLD